MKWEGEEETEGRGIRGGEEGLRAESERAMINVVILQKGSNWWKRSFHIWTLVWRARCDPQLRRFPMGGHAESAQILLMCLRYLLSSLSTPLSSSLVCFISNDVIVEKFKGVPSSLVFLANATDGPFVTRPRCKCHLKTSCSRDQLRFSPRISALPSLSPLSSLSLALFFSFLHSYAYKLLF